VREVEDAVVLASAHEDAEALARMVALLEGELVEARRAQEVAKEKFHSFEMERWEQFKELSLPGPRAPSYVLPLLGHHG
jgi:hypothetical protein